MSTAARRPRRNTKAARRAAALRTVMTQREWLGLMLGCFAILAIGVHAHDAATHYVAIASAAAGFFYALADRTRLILITRRYR
jgi:hypothetical protein